MFWRHFKRRVLQSIILAFGRFRRGRIVWERSRIQYLSLSDGFNANMAIPCGLIAHNTTFSNEHVLPGASKGVVTSTSRDDPTSPLTHRCTIASLHPPGLNIAPLSLSFLTKPTMSNLPWSMSSTLLVISATGLCLSRRLRALHPLTKTLLLVAVCQLLRLDGMGRREEGGGGE